MRNRVLWVLQCLLAVHFVFSAATKFLFDRQALIDQGQTWAEGFGQPVIYAIATAELLGGLGVVLPAATRVLPVLTPLAAAGLAAVLAGAVVTHVLRGEWGMATLPLVELGIAAYVARARFADLGRTTAPATT